ncbi:MAG: 50S ribosomal protein L21 [Parcubacteria group bacterium]|nr:50S ribosomal protein L21 [Parcubacteria group bacterium]
MQYAVIQTGGKQYVVHEKQVLRIEKINGAKNDMIVFDDVIALFNAETNDVSIGAPKLSAKVDAKIISQGRAKKVSVVKYKPKVRYHKRVGHRQHFTEIKIEKING